MKYPINLKKIFEDRRNSNLTHEKDEEYKNLYAVDEFYSRKRRYTALICYSWNNWLTVGYADTEDEAVEIANEALEEANENDYRTCINSQYDGIGIRLPNGELILYA